MAGPSVDTVYISSDNLVHVTKVQSKLTGAYISDAAVTLLRLVEADGDEDGDIVAGSTNIDCAAVAGVDGAYAGVLPDDAAALLVKDSAYFAYVEIDGGAGRLKTVRRALVAAWANA